MFDRTVGQQDIMTTEIDSLTIKDFESRYGVARSNIYNRIDGLKKKGYAMEPEKQNGKSVFNADQISLMDSLDLVLKEGGSIADFPAANGAVELSHRPTGQVEKSYRTQDTRQDNGSIMLFGGMIDAIAGKVADILSIRQQETSPQIPSSPPADPLANIRALQEVCDQGWLLSSSQLAPLLGLKTLHGKEFERFGFKFVKVGKNGLEAAWRVEKL
jgi:hypothetical protein